MQRNTSITLGKHLTDFVESIISQGRFESKSEAVRAFAFWLRARSCSSRIEVA